MRVAKTWEFSQKDTIVSLVCILLLIMLYIGVFCF